MDFKNFKSGYQNKPDQMRELAERLTDPRRGHEAEFTFSKSAADRERMRPYKTGGMVCKEDMSKKMHLSSNHHIEKMKKDISKEEERERKAEREKNQEKKKETFKAEHAYKKGGHVKGCDKQKFAMGGTAKERLDENYKKGGHVKSCNEKQKFAAGGGVIAKVRLDEASADGKQLLKKKKSYTNNF